MASCPPGFPRFCSCAWTAPRSLGGLLLPHSSACLSHGAGGTPGRTACISRFALEPLGDAAGQEAIFFQHGTRSQSLGSSPRVNLTLIPLLIHSKKLSTCPGLGATLPPRIRGPCLSVAPPAAAASPRLCPCGYGVQKGGPPLSPGSCSRQHIQDDSSTLSEGPGVAPVFWTSLSCTHHKGTF